MKRKQKTKKQPVKKRQAVIRLSDKDRVFGRGSGRKTARSRNLLGRYANADQVASERDRISEFEDLYPGISHQELVELLYPKPETVRQEFITDALTFPENLDTYLKLRVRFTVIDQDGMRFRYNRNQGARAEALMERIIGDLWRQCTEARKKLESKGKKMSPDKYIPQWVVIQVYTPVTIIRVFVDFSRNNVKGNLPDISNEPETFPEI